MKASAKTIKKNSLTELIWNEDKKHCIDKSLKYSDYVESLLKKDLGIK